MPKFKDGFKVYKWLQFWISFIFWILFGTFLSRSAQSSLQNWPFRLCWYCVTTRMIAKLAQITTLNTTQHTTTNMSRCHCHPTLQWLSPLSPLGWQRRPQILALRLPHECVWGSSRQVCTHPFSSPCLRYPNLTHWIIERGGGPWP